MCPSDVLHCIEWGPSGVLDLAVDIETGVDNLYGLNIRIHQDVERRLRAKVNIARTIQKSCTKRKERLTGLKQDGFNVSFLVQVFRLRNNDSQKGCLREKVSVQYLWSSKKCKPMIITINTQRSTRVITRTIK